jgi:predicted transcriptional regulator
MRKLIKNALHEHKMVKSVRVLSDDDITNIGNKQAANKEQFADIFQEMNEIVKLKFTNEQQQQGAYKALMILHNYILNREIKQS